MKKRIGLLFVITLCTAATPQAHARFGLNAGASYLLGGSTAISSGVTVTTTGGVGYPLAGIHFELGGSSIVLRNYIEYQTIKMSGSVSVAGLSFSATTTTQSIAGISLLTLRGSRFFLGAGGGVNYISKASAIAPQAAAGLGFYFTQMIFAEARAQYDLQGGSFSKLPLFFQLGFSL